MCNKSKTFEDKMIFIPIYKRANLLFSSMLQWLSCDASNAHQVVFFLLYFILFVYFTRTKQAILILFVYFIPTNLYLFIIHVLNSSYTIMGPSSVSLIADLLHACSWFSCLWPHVRCIIYLFFYVTFWNFFWNAGSNLSNFILNCI